MKIMKVIYVGDNRNRGNFGCRATSTALSQIIEQEHEIVGTVYGKYTLYTAYKKLSNSEEKIIFGGRLGEYKYYDMDQVIVAALEMFERVNQ